MLSLSDPSHAGILRIVPARISGSQVSRPHCAELPELIQRFVENINICVPAHPELVEGRPVGVEERASIHPALLAAKAHLQFVFIHPFVDGNSRTARLLMNLLLLQAGYPLTVISVEQRNEYIDNIENALLLEKPEGFYEFIYQAIEKSLDDYLDAVSNSAC